MSMDYLADSVICDPPFDPEHYRAFLIQASMVSQVGGHVFVSLLPSDTRPTARRDRDDIFDMAHILGMELVGLYEHELEYQFPAFEVASLLATGQSVASASRRSDLAVFVAKFIPDRTS